MPTAAAWLVPGCGFPAGTTANASHRNFVPPRMQVLQRNVRALTPAEMQTLESVATSAENLETEYMDNRVFDLSLKAKAADDDRLADTYSFLAGVLRPRVEVMADIDSSANPFHVTPKSLTDEEIELLRDLTATVRDPELRARFADFLWLRTRDRQYGEIAVDAYLASALRLRDPENWLGAAGRYERAVSVAASLGKKNDRYMRSIATVEEYLAELNGTDPLFMSERLMSILLDQKQGDRSRYAALAGKCAVAAEQRGNFFLALHYWNLKVRWHVASQDADGERESRIAAAESVIKDGECRTTGEQASFTAAADFIHRGLAMLTKAAAPQQRIDEVAARLKEYQQKSLAELKRRTVTFDATEIVNAARAAVAGKSLPDALAAFAALPHLPNRAEVRREVLRRAKTFVFSHIFGEVKLNAQGAPIAGRGSVSGDETEETNNVLALMYQDVVHSFSVEGQTTIEPAWRQIQDEHDIREQDMSVIVHQSWFVPPSREPFFAKGLAAGLNGDLMVAIHLLVPQIEAAIRWHLQRRGVTTMKANREGYHEERDLNQLLALPETKTLLSEPVHFALTALLTSRFGYNLRNDLAHALIEPRDCYSTVSLFFFALVMMICVRTMPQQSKAEESSSEEET